MDRYLPPITTSILTAVDLFQKTDLYSKCLHFYRHSTRNELLVLGGATFLTVYNFISYIKARREKLNLPPRVGYAFPLLGHLPYLLYDSNRFLDWCSQKYGDLYDINIAGSITTVASGHSAEEALKAVHEDLSLEEGVLKDVLYLHYVLDEMTFEMGFKANPPVAKDVIASHKIGRLTERIERGLERGLRELGNGQDNLRLDNPSFFLQRFVAYMSVSSLVGEEVETNLEVIQSFADFTGDVTNNVGIFMAVPTVLHRFIVPFLQKVEWHRKVMRKHVLPIVRDRRRKIREAAEHGQDHGLDPNFLQGLIEHKKEDGSQYTDEEVAQSVLLIAFASVHTTSMNLSFCIYWLLARPDLRAELEKEIAEVLGDKPITNESLKEMKFLEQFIREVLRQGVDKLATTKAVMREVYTFANGYQVPKGRRVQSANRQLNMMGLNATRSEVDQMDPAMSGKKLATQPGRDFVTFGLGKHLCPGRFFAVHEIKMSLIVLLRRYDIATVSGKTPSPNRYLGGMISVTSEDPLILTKKSSI
ncbi:cytochrome P450 [Fennellomyces sp. T-0311]|nr:cytochrome P450 [Fennellomyces sp. T-0311]